MRSHCDLDSKTLSQKRQRLTPREPPPSPSRAHPSTSVKTITERSGAQSGDGSTPSRAAFRLPVAAARQLSAALPPLTSGKFLERELRECRGCLDKLFALEPTPAGFWIPSFCWDDSRELPGGMTAEHLWTISAATSPSKWFSDESPIPLSQEACSRKGLLNQNPPLPRFPLFNWIRS